MSHLNIQLAHINRPQALKSRRDIMFHAETRQSMTEIEIWKPFHEVFEGARWYEDIGEKTATWLNWSENLLEWWDNERETKSIEGNKN